MRNNENKKVKKARMKHGKRGVSRLFSNTKFVLIISLLLSVVIWIMVSLSDTNESNVTISNIPININLSESATNSGLKIFSGADQTASVTVTGNRVAMGSVSSDDIVVSAPNAGTITTYGNYPLSLTARKANSGDNFEISSSVTPSIITVFVDYEKEAQFDIKNQIKYKVADGYFAAVSLSAEKITVSGPQSEVNKIAAVGISGEIKEKLESDTSLDCDVKLYDSSGEEVSNSMLTLSNDKITASFAVNPQKELPIKLGAVNFPDDFDYTQYVSMSLDKISISGPKDTIENTDAIYTENVDLTSLSNTKKELTLKLNIPTGCTNLSEINTVDVTIDFSSFKKKSVKISDSDNFEVVNLDNKYKCDVTTDSLTVIVIASENIIDSLTASNVRCRIDMSDIEGNTGSLQHEASIVFDDGYSDCWAYGKYKVNISVSEK